VAVDDPAQVRGVVPAGHDKLFEDLGDNALARVQPGGSFVVASR
jgi:hypothetical protein